MFAEFKFPRTSVGYVSVGYVRKKCILHYPPQTLKMRGDPLESSSQKVFCEIKFRNLATFYLNSNINTYSTEDYKSDPRILIKAKMASGAVV